MKRNLSPYKRQNIIITGAGGYIGRYLWAYLKDHHNILNIISQKSKPMENTVRLDLRDKEGAKNFFKHYRRKNKVDIIIHLASKLLSVVDYKDLSLFYDNIKITETIVGIAGLLSPKKIINFSTMAVYPNESGLYSETSEIRTSVNFECLYGLSKFCSENILDFMLKDSGIIISHLRVAQVYAERMRQDRLIPVMLQELKENNSITIFGNGQRVSCFIQITKLLEIVELFIRRDLPGVFNIGEEHLSYIELARRLIRRYGNKHSRIVRKASGCRAKFYLDTRKIQEVRHG